MHKRKGRGKESDFFHSHGLCQYDEVQERMILSMHSSRSLHQLNMSVLAVNYFHSSVAQLMHMTNRSALETVYRSRTLKVATEDETNRQRALLSKSGVG